MVSKKTFERRGRRRTILTIFFLLSLILVVVGLVASPERRPYLFLWSWTLSAFFLTGTIVFGIFDIMMTRWEVKLQWDDKSNDER